MIKLQSLEVKNFKSLIDTSIEKFGDVNMFYGFNNCGKSNVFKFLKLLFNKKREGTTVRVKDDRQSEASTLLTTTTNFWNGSILGEPFLFTKNKRNIPITFKVELLVSNDLLPEANALKDEKLLGEENTRVILIGRITSTNVEVSYLEITQCLINSKEFYSFEDEVETYFTGIENEKLTDKVGLQILSLFNDLVLFIDSDRNFTKEISKDGINILDIKNFKNALHELNMNAEKNELFTELISFLKKFDFSKDAKNKLSANIQSFPFGDETDLGFTKFEDELEIMLKNNSGRYPLKNYGTGIQQFLYLLTSIFSSNSRIIILEELELNLSPLYQKELLRFFKLLMPGNFDQLIFSSHSPFFTQKEAVMVDIVHHVQIDMCVAGGTSVDCHDDIASTYDENSGESFFSLLYS